MPATIVEARGMELRHFENRVPNGTRRILGKVAAVIVIVGMVSHSLRDQVKDLVSEDAPVVYLRTASVSALRTAVSSASAVAAVRINATPAPVRVTFPTAHPKLMSTASAPEACTRAAASAMAAGSAPKSWTDRGRSAGRLRR